MLKNEITRNDSRFKLFTLNEKEKAIVLIEDYLSTDIKLNDNELQEKRKRIKAIREELKLLQNSDDYNKIKALSSYITELYKSAKDISSVVDDDINQDGFQIQYFKKGNILLQTKEKVNYYIGSMARHTLIQLCGYLVFLRMLLQEDKYPLIPILVIDHISKPFDKSNSKAIGKVIPTAYESIGKENLQIFMFDDEEYEKLDLNPDHSENLVTENKTGFNPFYFPLEQKDEK